MTQIVSAAHGWFLRQLAVQHWLAWMRAVSPVPVAALLSIMGCCLILGFVLNRKKSLICMFFDFADVSWAVRFRLDGARRTFTVEKIPFCKMCKAPMNMSDLDEERLCRIGCAHCGSFLLKFPIVDNYAMVKRLIEQEYSFLLRNRRRREVRLGGTSTFHYEG